MSAGFAAGGRVLDHGSGQAASAHNMNGQRRA
jgi:hypothetical protein